MPSVSLRFVDRCQRSTVAASRRSGLRRHNRARNRPPRCLVDSRAARRLPVLARRDVDGGQGWTTPELPVSSGWRLGLTTPAPAALWIAGHARARDDNAADPRPFDLGMRGAEFARALHRIARRSLLAALVARKRTSTAARGVGVRVGRCRHWPGAFSESAASRLANLAVAQLCIA